MWKKKSETQLFSVEILEYIVFYFKRYQKNLLCS